MERVGRGGRTTPPTDGRAEGGARARDVYADARAPEVEAVRSMGCVCLCLGRTEMCEEERENSLPRSLISSTRLSRGLRVCAPGARTQPGGTGDSPPFQPSMVLKFADAGEDARQAARAAGNVYESSSASSSSSDDEAAGGDAGDDSDFSAGADAAPSLDGSGEEAGDGSAGRATKQGDAGAGGPSARGRSARPPPPQPGRVRLQLAPKPGPASYLPGTGPHLTCHVS